VAKHFNIWFGAIFLAVGAVCLIVGALLLTAFVFMPGAPAEAWIAVVVPASVGGMFAAVGAAFMVSGLRRRRTEQRLREVGTTTEATVVSIEQTGVRVNRRRLWRVRYIYDNLTGMPRQGDSGYLSAEEAHRYAVGETVLVRYDPTNPTVSAWIGHDELPR